MRILILITLLFASVVGSFADTLHASAPDHTCVYHQMDQDDNVDNGPCHSEQNQNHDDNNTCDDCYCVHSHSIATTAMTTKTPLNVNKQNIIALADHHHSIDISGPKRPPRL